MHKIKRFLRRFGREEFRIIKHRQYEGDTVLEWFTIESRVYGLGEWMPISLCDAHDTYEEAMAKLQEEIKGYCQLKECTDEVYYTISPAIHEEIAEYARQNNHSIT